MIDILTLIQQRASIKLHGRPTNHYRNGIEYHSSCPFCNTGIDRFCIWVSAGRFMCRQCGHYGDMLGFLMQYEDMSYFAACRELDVDPRYPEDAHPELPLFMTKDEEPNKKWQSSAELFVWRAERYLWTPGGERGLDYLHSRGLNDDTLRKARIGFVPDWFSEPLQNWGLSTSMTLEDEEIKIPCGIIIPWFVGGKVWKLSVRRSDGSYFQSLGSSDGGLYNIDGLQPENPAFLYESEIDALSAMQEASDLAAHIATGGSAKGQTSPLRHRLKQASHLLIGFDLDEAGEDGARYWLKMPHALRWTPWRHDVNELLQQQAILVRMWVECGLRTATTQIEATFEPEPPAEPEKKKYVLPPWIKVNDRGLPEFCSVGMCKNRAIAWSSNAVSMNAYCEKHKPANFGWEKQKQVALAL